MSLATEDDFPPPLKMNGKQLDFILMKDIFAELKRIERSGPIYENGETYNIMMRYVSFSKDFLTLSRTDAKKYQMSFLKQAEVFHSELRSIDMDRPKSRLSVAGKKPLVYNSLTYGLSYILTWYYDRVFYPKLEECWNISEMLVDLVTITPRTKKGELLAVIEILARTGRVAPDLISYLSSGEYKLGPMNLITGLLKSFNNFVETEGNPIRNSAYINALSHGLKKDMEKLVIKDLNRELNDHLNDAFTATLLARLNDEFEENVRSRDQSLITSETVKHFEKPDIDSTLKSYIPKGWESYIPEFNQYIPDVVGSVKTSQKSVLADGLMRTVKSHIKSDFDATTLDGLIADVKRLNWTTSGFSGSSKPLSHQYIELIEYVKDAMVNIQGSFIPTFALSIAKQMATNNTIMTQDILTDIFRSYMGIAKITDNDMSVYRLRMMEWHLQLSYLREAKNALMERSFFKPIWTLIVEDYLKHQYFIYAIYCICIFYIAYFVINLFTLKMGPMKGSFVKTISDKYSKFKFSSYKNKHSKYRNSSKSRKPKKSDKSRKRTSIRRSKILHTADKSRKRTSIRKSKVKKVVRSKRGSF